MILDFKGNVEKETRTAGGTFAAMDLVKQDANDGKYTIVAPDGVKVAGLALTDGVDGSEFQLLPLIPGITKIMIGIETQANVDTAEKRLILCGKFVALVGATGAQEINEDKFDADLLKVEDVVWHAGLGEYVAWVTAAYTSAERFVEPS